MLADPTKGWVHETPTRVPGRVESQMAARANVLEGREKRSPQDEMISPPAIRNVL